MNLQIEIKHANLGHLNTDYQRQGLLCKQVFDQQKSLKLQKAVPRNKPRPSYNKYYYHWTRTEDKRYVDFLIKNRQLLDLTNEEKKCIKINVIMSDAIKTRSAAQCHSHHQKMMDKFGGIDSFIQAHLHLVTKVPKKYISLMKRLQDANMAVRNQPTFIDQGCQTIKQSSRPEWMSYINSDSNLIFHEDQSSFS